jgi:hydrogenase nickel incorporation protein HypA/HybF
MGIAIEVHRQSREAVREHGAGRIDRVLLAVGELSAVEPDLMAYAWEAVVAGGPDEGSVLEVRWCPAEQHCATCGEAKTRSEGSWLRICPDCGMPLTVTGGDELDIERVIFISDDEEDG